MHVMNMHGKYEYAWGGSEQSRRARYRAAMRIAEIRRARGLTQVELAARAGVEQATISRAEKGFEGTTLRALRGIAAALDVTLSDLVADEREESEAALLAAYRALPPAQRQGWLQLARALAPAAEEVASQAG